MNGDYKEMQSPDQLRRSRRGAPTTSSGASSGTPTRTRTSSARSRRLPFGKGLNVVRGSHAFIRQGEDRRATCGEVLDNKPSSRP